MHSAIATASCLSDKALLSSNAMLMFVTEQIIALASLTDSCSILIKKCNVLFKISDVKVIVGVENIASRKADGEREN